jgi:hypothetical protein
MVKGSEVVEEAKNWQQCLSVMTLRRPPEIEPLSLADTPFKDYVPDLELENNHMAEFLDSFALCTLQPYAFANGNITLMDAGVGYGFHLNGSTLKAIGGALSLERIMQSTYKVESETLAEPSGDVYLLISAAARDNGDPGSIKLVKLSPHEEAQWWPVPSRYVPEEDDVVHLTRCGPVVAWYAGHIGCVVSVSVRAPFVTHGLILNELRLANPPIGPCRVWFDDYKLYMVCTERLMCIEEHDKYIPVYWVAL